MSLSKRLDEARQAYKTGDIEASAKAHTSQKISESAKEKHGGTSSQYMSNIVYGSLDGIITTFAVVSGVVGANLDTRIILIMGLANLFGDGFSMATGAFLSAKSDKEFYDRERAREAWEVEHFPDGEASELIAIYKDQGYPDEDAQAMVAIKKKDPTRWVNAMMVEELGLMKDDRKPISEAVTTFMAFVIAGSVPLVYYLLDLVFHFNLSSQTAFFISMGLSALALFGVGAAKVLVTERNALRSGLEMLLVGGLAAAVAFIVGLLLKGLGVG
jgi:VIT1/CCC1 family predicted Fe2+/Mn2+ transporter